MTPGELHAALLRQVLVLQAQRQADPYGFAFGPRRPFDGSGYRGRAPLATPPPALRRQAPLPPDLGLYHGWGSAVAPGAGLQMYDHPLLEHLQNYRVQRQPPSRL